MTIEKITLSNELTPAGMVLVGKVHEIIDVVSSLTGGEKEEPKSNTLRAEILYYLFQTEDATVNVKAEKILSLVKEHLLAELPEADKGGMSLGSIKQIIKNL